MQKVEEYYRKLGITKESVNAKHSNLMQSFYSEYAHTSGDNYDPYHYDRVDHLYDTREDEIRSAKIQQMETKLNLLRVIRTRSNVRDKRCSTTAIVPTNPTFSELYSKPWSRYFSVD